MINSKKDFEKLVSDAYGINADYPFKDNSASVFRHESNKKWFAIIMTVDKSKLDKSQKGEVNIVNLKCSPEIIDSLWQEQGIYPAYHMNKSHWLSVYLDGSVDDKTIGWLLSISYDLTGKKLPKKNFNPKKQ